MGLAQRLRHGGMGVADAGNVFATGTVLHGQDGFVDQLPGHAADEMHAENFVRFLVGEDFDESVGVVVALGPTVGRQREFSDFVRGSGLLEVLLGFPHPSHFRMRVNHGRNAIVVNVNRAAGDAWVRV